MSQVLYRKYRSKKFAEIMGQKHIVEILKESILNDSLSHGYLFCGPRGTGKTSIARLMAKAVNCERFKELGDVCNECTFCKVINDGESMDIIEMDAASNRGIEEIRSMRDTVNYMPSSLKRKIYIIDEAHMLTKEAFNALLKTLEEPPEHVIFIMATTEPHKLPITILSRVQRYDLSLASEIDLSQKISDIISQEGREIDNNSLKIIYLKSGGSFRDAESILGKVLSSTQKKKITDKDLYESLGIIEDQYIEDLIEALLAFQAERSLSLLNTIYEKSGSANNIIDQSIDKLREKIVNSINTLDKNIYNLANLFITLKGSLRDFNDKLGLIEIEFVNYCNVSSGKVTQSTAPTKTQEAKQVIAVQKEAVVEIVAEVVSEGEINTLEDLIEHIIIDSKGKYPRLKSILNSSKINQDKDTLVITNSHKFNIIYLDRKDVKSYLIEKALKINATNVKFEVGEGQTVVIVEDEVVETPKKVEKSSPKKAERKEDAQPKKVEAESQSKQIDNSDLVEGFL